MAMQQLNIWYKRFPNVKVCIGNHSALHKRKALANGLPERFISPMKMLGKLLEAGNGA